MTNNQLHNFVLNCMCMIRCSTWSIDH